MGVMPRNERLRHQRIVHNWRQIDLADQLGVTTMTVQRWERGSQQPGAYYRAKLCDLFGLDPHELGLIEEPSSSEEAQPKGDMAPASLTSPLRLWTMPYARNPHFTGRDDLLTHLTRQFASHEGERTSFIRRAALTQSQAIHGLGGIGKTQLAIEYVYRSLEADRYTHTLWISAASEELILTSFAELSTLLPALRQQGEHDERKLAKLVIRWLEVCDESWLMVFDNADDIEMASPYFPTRGNGDLLLTTRASAVGSFGSSLEVETMGLLEGAQFLLRRAHRLDQAADDVINEACNIVLELGQFPLAIDQAGAYIEETGCSLHHYLRLYHQHRQELLARRGNHAASYPNSVATTWSLSFQYLEQHHPAAAQCLQLSAFLAPDHIPEELLIDGASFWTPPLQQAVTDPLRFDEMLEALLAFSLVKRHTRERQLSIHRLVQAVQMEQISRAEQQQWASSVVLAVQHLFPHIQLDDTSSWPLCLRYLEQAQACDRWIQHYQLLFDEALDLLDRTGFYLEERALYSIAEPLLQRALHLREQHLGPDHLSAALSLQHLGMVYYRQGNYGQAGLLHMRALHIREQHLGLDHLEVAVSLNDLAMNYLLQDSVGE
jgi:transcriptional regulator with XRE-family HTH domain/tetratricopeptide (TPR) repeat protein